MQRIDEGKKNRSRIFSPQTFSYSQEEFKQKKGHKMSLFVKPGVSPSQAG